MPIKKLASAVRVNRKGAGPHSGPATPCPRPCLRPALSGLASPSMSNCECWTGLPSPPSPPLRCLALARHPGAAEGPAPWQTPCIANFFHQGGPAFKGGPGRTTLLQARLAGSGTRRARDSLDSLPPAPASSSSRRPSQRPQLTGQRRALHPSSISVSCPTCVSACCARSPIIPTAPPLRHMCPSHGSVVEKSTGPQESHLPRTRRTPHPRAAAAASPGFPRLDTARAFRGHRYTARVRVPREGLPACFHSPPRTSSSSRL